MSYKINLASIVPTSRTRDSITGNIAGTEVTISRCLNGWNPRLEITIDGHCVHDSEPTKDEVKEWHLLEAKAIEVESLKHEAKRKAIRDSEAFRKIFSL